MVDKNEIYEVDITAMGSAGEGIARIDGYALFVPFSAVGDRALVRVVKVGRNFGYGRIEQIIMPSPARTTPPCTAFGRCGGCSLMHLNYPAQLEFKRRRVADALERIGGFPNPDVAPCVSAEPLNYRNKAQFAVSQRDELVIGGVFAPRSHRVVEAASCCIQHDLSNQAMATVLEWMNRHGISAYDEGAHTGVVRHIYTRTGLNEFMVVIVTYEKNLPLERELMELLNGRFPTLKGLVQNINDRATNVILGGADRIIYGRDYILDELCSLTFKVSYRSFYQVNHTIAQAMYTHVSRLISFTGNEGVYDLYCGIGTMSLILAKHASWVIGVESVVDAVKDARENAKRNGITNVEFYEGQAESVVPELLARGRAADVVVVDPPRKGCDLSLLETISRMNPSKIIYVSCDAGTAARDLKYLAQQGYVPGVVTPFDQFPFTSHVECVVGLCRS